MSSFIRNAATKKRKTGITVLDKFINTLEPGTIVLIKEDEYSFIHNYLLNIFLSEGVCENESRILAVSINGPVEIYQVDNEKVCDEQLSKMYIAWRYNNLRPDKSDCKFLLTDKLDYRHDLMAKNDITVDNIIERLNSCSNYRVALFSLFSPSYKVNNIYQALYNIRKAVRLHGHVCMISIPTFFYDKVIFDQYFDIVMSLDSNFFTNLLPNYKAIIHFEKITFLNKIRENNTDTYKFGIKFYKNKLVIEKIDIPPVDIEQPSIDCRSF